MPPTREMIYKKAVQALNFFAEKKGGTINKMKAIKLIYFADRLHLRKYSRPIVGDAYWAMKLGPVASRTKDVADFADTIPSEVLRYAKKYLKSADSEKITFISLSKTDLDLFSDTDIACLNAVYDAFSDRDQFELARLTHEMPEWKKHKKELAAGKKRVRMDYKDFFAETKHDLGLFNENPSHLEHAKESFEEAEKVAAFFTS